MSVLEGLQAWLSTAKFGDTDSGGKMYRRKAQRKVGLVVHYGLCPEGQTYCYAYQSRIMRLLDLPVISRRGCWMFLEVIKYSTRNRKETTYAEQLGPLLKIGTPNARRYSLLLCKLRIGAL